MHTNSNTLATDTLTSDTLTADIAPADQPTTSTPPARRKPGLRRLLAGALAALTIGTGVGALHGAQQADAASSVGYCFKTRTGMIVAPATTYLELYYSGRWNRVASGSTSTWNGCGSFSMSGTYQGYYARVSLSFRDTRSGNTFYGVTPLMALPGNLAVHLGTGTLSCYGGPCYGA